MGNIGMLYNLAYGFYIFVSYTPTILQLCIFLLVCSAFLFTFATFNYYAHEKDIITFIRGFYRIIRGLP